MQTYLERIESFATQLEFNLSHKRQDIFNDIDFKSVEEALDYVHIIPQPLADKLINTLATQAMRRQLFWRMDDLPKPYFCYSVILKVLKKSNYVVRKDSPLRSMLLTKKFLNSQHVAIIAELLNGSDGSLIYSELLSVFMSCGDVTYTESLQQLLDALESLVAGWFEKNPELLWQILRAPQYNTSPDGLAPHTFQIIIAHLVSKNSAIAEWFCHKFSSCLSASGASELVMPFITDPLYPHLLGGLSASLVKVNAWPWQDIDPIGLIDKLCNGSFTQVGAKLALLMVDRLTPKQKEDVSKTLLGFLKSEVYVDVRCSSLGYPLVDMNATLSDAIAKLSFSEGNKLMSLTELSALLNNKIKNTEILKLAHVVLFYQDEPLSYEDIVLLFSGLKNTRKFFNHNFNTEFTVISTKIINLLFKKWPEKASFLYAQVQDLAETSSWFFDFQALDIPLQHPEEEKAFLERLFNFMSQHQQFLNKHVYIDFMLKRLHQIEYKSDSMVSSLLLGVLAASEHSKCKQDLRVILIAALLDEHSKTEAKLTPELLALLIPYLFYELLSKPCESSFTREIETRSGINTKKLFAPQHLDVVEKCFIYLIQNNYLDVASFFAQYVKAIKGLMCDTEHEAYFLNVLGRLTLLFPLKEKNPDVPTLTSVYKHYLAQLDVKTMRLNEAVCLCLRTLSYSPIEQTHFDDCLKKLMDANFRGINKAPQDSDAMHQYKPTDADKMVSGNTLLLITSIIKHWTGEFSPILNLLIDTWLVPFLSWAPCYFIEKCDWDAGEKVDLKPLIQGLYTTLVSKHWYEFFESYIRLAVQHPIYLPLIKDAIPKLTDAECEYIMLMDSRRHKDIKVLQNTLQFLRGVSHDGRFFSVGIANYKKLLPLDNAMDDAAVRKIRF